MAGGRLQRFELGVCIIVALTVASLGRNSAGGKNRIVVADEDFYMVRQGSDRELWLSYDGYLASDKSLHSGGWTVTYRRVTDGTSFYEGVMDGNGQLRDCEIKTQRGEIEHFVREFQRDTKQSRRRRGRANVTLSYTPLTTGQVDREVLKHAGELTNLKKLTRECKSLHDGLNEEYHQKEKYEERARVKRSFGIFPGTKWCGSGSTATHDNDLGSNMVTDKCCREHDKCPYYILGFETKWNLYNSWFGTISHCDCDNSFKNCLRSAKTGLADMVGKIFFNLIKRSCFVLRKRKVCTQRSWWGKCTKREKQLIGKYKGIRKYKPL